MTELDELTDKRRVFVEEYLQCWNGSEAARRAGYAYPGREAYRLLKNDVIQEIVQERIREKAMSADEVLVHLADVARFDPGLIFGKVGIIDWDQAKRDSLTRFVKKVEWSTTGLKVEFHDRMEALELLGKHHRLFAERHEFSGPGGEPLTVRFVWDDSNRDPDAEAAQSDAAADDHL